ncbi:cellulase family glycosylhydrolase [Edaphobacter bradus]|uniref:cellulase family glycosylhydrolase n=1 Tax=Edaphobacter bradus TaxID=2259016 RepID=UPI0021DF920C|nr:cellulase family glycosylhydrolase [Edaphobacter bradus]
MHLRIDCTGINCVRPRAIHNTQTVHTPKGQDSLRPLRRMLLTLAAVLALTAMGADKASAQLSMLQTSGRSIVNASGQKVPLMGVNLGGWFIMEKWMCPLDSGSLPDTFSVMQELDNRFGVATEQSLIKTYQQNWITTTDLDNIKNAGFNVVRVPVWWGQFYLLNNVSNSGWRSDAFDMLDWLVNAAGARGLYVIIDMHGVVGGQSTSDDTGQANQNQYWTNGNDQGNTAWMWWQIASHYKGNPTVAGYDLINEPTGAPNNSAVINAYNSLYQSVRSADPSHIIFMEGAFGNWNWSMLPDPSQNGWTNVVYEMHEYKFNGSQAQVEQGATNQVNDFNNHASYNVPGYIGEFNDFGYPAAWQFSVNAWNQAGLSWTMWAYKATHGLNPDSWGFYDPSYWPPTPNISSDSSSTIAADWQQWATTNSFTLNTSIGLSGNVNGASVSTSSWFNVVNQNSGSCVDAAGWGTTNGTIVQQWSCGNQQYNQEWQFQSQGNGIYSIVNRNAPGEVWDVTNRGTSNGSLLQLWSYGGGSNQQWMPVSLGNGRYKFVGVGSGRCLDVPGASTANGVQLQIYDCNGTAAQSFQLSSQP